MKQELMLFQCTFYILSYVYDINVFSVSFEVDVIFIYWNMHPGL